MSYLVLFNNFITYLCLNQFYFLSWNVFYVGFWIRLSQDGWTECFQKALNSPSC